MQRSALSFGSIMVAALAAGPIFAIWTTLSTLSNTPASDDIRFGTIVLAIPLAVFGWLVAILPCAAGAAMMARLGRGNLGLRLPAMWALAGGALAAIPMVASEDFGNPGQVALVATGAACALICRIGVRWDLEPRPEPAPRRTASCITTPPAANAAILQRKGILR